MDSIHKALGEFLAKRLGQPPTRPERAAPRPKPAPKPRPKPVAAPGTPAAHADTARQTSTTLLARVKAVGTPPRVDKSATLTREQIAQLERRPTKVRFADPRAPAASAEPCDMELDASGGPGTPAPAERPARSPASGLAAWIRQRAGTVRSSTRLSSSTSSSSSTSGSGSGSGPAAGAARPAVALKRRSLREDSVERRGRTAIRVAAQYETRGTKGVWAILQQEPRPARAGGT